jgi:vitamin B12 transporter
VTLFGRVENVLDKKYQEVWGFDEPGIGAFIGIRTSFGL